MLQNYNPKTCAVSLKGVNTVALALSAGTPTIGRLKRELGQLSIEAYFKVWIINLTDSINCTRPLKEHQIDECAELIVEEFNNLTIADINIIFKRAKTGHYGELYETLSIDKILRWFTDYFEERCQTAARNSRREAHNHKHEDPKIEEKTGLSTERVNELLNTIGKGGSKKRKFDEEKYKEIKKKYLSGEIQEGIQEGDIEQSNKKNKSTRRRTKKYTKGSKRISRTVGSHNTNRRRVRNRKRN